MWNLGPQGQTGSWALPVPILSSGQHTAPLSALHGLSSERCSQGLPPPAQPACGSQEGAVGPASPASFQSSQTDLCSATETGREQVRPQGGPADPAEPPGCLHPSVLVPLPLTNHPGPVNPEPGPPQGGTAHSVPFPKGGGWRLRQRGVTPGERQLPHVTTRLAVPGEACT